MLLLLCVCPCFSLPLVLEDWAHPKEQSIADPRACAQGCVVVPLLRRNLEKYRHPIQKSGCSGCTPQTFQKIDFGLVCRQLSSGAVLGVVEVGPCSRQRSSSQLLALLVHCSEGSGQGERQKGFMSLPQGRQLMCRARDGLDSSVCCVHRGGGVVSPERGCKARGRPKTTLYFPWCRYFSRNRGQNKKKSLCGRAPGAVAGGVLVQNGRFAQAASTTDPRRLNAQRILRFCLSDVARLHLST